MAKQSMIEEGKKFGDMKNGPPPLKNRPRGEVKKVWVNRNTYLELPAEISRKEETARVKKWRELHPVKEKTNK